MKMMLYFSVGVSISTLAVHVPSTLQMIDFFGNGDFRIHKKTCKYMLWYPLTRILYQQW